MSTAPWDDESTPTREREAVDIDLEPTAIVHRTEQHVQRHELDFASLCQVAQQLGPRDYRAMRERAREVGTMLGAQLQPDGTCAGYYSWEQGGRLIEGPTVDLMESLAEVWGRTVKSVEVVRESEDSIELVGVVVDLLTLVATRRPFTSALMPTPGKYRSSPEQAQRWRASQVQAATSRAIRGALEHSLPGWLTSAGVACAKVAHAKAVLGSASLQEVLPKALAHLERQWGLDELALVAWLEVPRAGWTIAHVAQLRALAEDLRDGRRTVESVRGGEARPDPPHDVGREARPWTVRREQVFSQRRRVEDLVAHCLIGLRGLGRLRGLDARSLRPRDRGLAAAVRQSRHARTISQRWLDHDTRFSDDPEVIPW